MKPFIQVKEVRNRSERRKMLFELKRNLEKVNELENLFINMLFNADELYSYYDLYNYTKLNFINLKEWMKLTNKLKYTDLNEEYFRVKYFPLEKIN